MLSIIITCFNENGFVQKTITSILRHTEMAHEIILIDDASTDDLNLMCFSKYPNFKFFRNEERKGLIYSRIIGANLASFEYLVFMDAHCNPEPSWESNLISASLIFKDRIIAVPVIPQVDADNWKNSIDEKGYSMVFNERLEMKWLKGSFSDGRYLESAIYAGCVALIAKRFYFELQGFDDGLYLWGGENIDLSLRCWMFGGKVLVVKSSVVGHVFKSRLRYPVAKQVITLNLLRVAFINFSSSRYERVLRTYRVDNHNFNHTLDSSIAIELRRNHLLKGRIYDDDWYMNKFRIVV